MTQASGDLRKVEEDQDCTETREQATLLTRLQGMLLAASRFFASHYWILCVLIGGVALAFNLFRLGSKSIWFDEVLSVERARQSLPVLWQIIFATQPNMAFYYIFLHFWLGFTSLLGLNPTEFVVRFPSAIFAALSSVMIFLLGRRFLGRFKLGVIGVDSVLNMLHHLRPDSLDLFELLWRHGAQFFDGADACLHQLFRQLLRQAKVSGGELRALFRSELGD